MRLHVDSFFALACSVFTASVGAQTIADYSRSQRALLEATMAQAAARSAALSASSAASASAAPAPMPPAAPARPSASAAEALVSVGGVFESPARVLAEIVVNGTPYLLAPGQPVPGTPWRIAAIDVEHVVLTRPGNTMPGIRGEPRGVTQIFALPAPRWSGATQ
jgi:type IV pilus biogenesis protein PilP